MTTAAAMSIHPMRESARRYRLMQVNSFTRTRLAGNSCAVIFGAQDMDDATMLAVAREMNLSVSSFVLTPRKSNFRARYFSLEGEIPIAGHPTLATIHALYKTGQIEMFDGEAAVTLELGCGLIAIDLSEEEDGAVLITMEQKAPSFMRTLDAKTVARVVGVDELHLIESVPPQVVSTGVPQLMIALKTLDALKRARPDLSALAELQHQHGLSGVHLFCLQGVTESGDTFARNFDAPPEILEEPFTGSATGAMAAYCWRYGLIKEPRFTAQQGHWINRPGEAYVEVVGTRYDMDTVRVGGYAVTVLTGELTL